MGVCLDIMRQSAGMALNPTMVYSFVFPFFNCTDIIQTSD